MDYAPILIQVYNRFEHFIQCVESLKRCTDAINTDLFIASDAAFCDKDVKLVDEIRLYSQSIVGFRNVTLISPASNLGAVGSLKNALKLIFSKYDRVIYTEDDNIFSPNFLVYMNKGLSYYLYNTSVFSICGYKHPFSLSQSSGNIFGSPIYSAWGVGLWREKFNNVDFYPMNNYLAICKKYPNMHFGWYDLIYKVLKDKVHIADVSIELHCLERNMFNIYPCISLVRNIGNDGSGENCGVNTMYASQDFSDGHDEFYFSDKIKLNPYLIFRQKLGIDYPFDNLFLAYFKYLCRRIKQCICII